MKTIMSEIALIAVTLSTLTQLAIARPPEFYTFHLDRTITDTQLCGFPIEVHDEGDLRIAFHFDNAGNIEWVNDTTSKLSNHTHQPGDWNLPVDSVTGTYRGNRL